MKRRIFLISITHLSFIIVYFFILGKNDLVNATETSSQTTEHPQHTVSCMVHPGVGKDAFGDEAPALDIEGIYRACGVNRIFTLPARNEDTKPVEVFKKALACEELALVIVALED